MKYLRFSRFSLASTALGAIFLASCTPRDEPIAQSTPAPLKVVDTIMVPGADDKLHPKKVSRLALDTQHKRGGNAAPALDEIIKLAPQWFPKGARVEDVKDDGSVVTLLLSPEWGNAKHWQKGESLTEVAIYSLVNTLAKDGKKVALTLEGKPIPALGEFDTSEALEAEPGLNALTTTKVEGAPKPTDATPASGETASNSAAQ